MAVVQGLMHEALRGFLDTFAHSAVTATDLLCYLAHTLAGCPIGDTDGPIRCRPLRVPGAAGAAAAANATVLSGGTTGSSCATVVPWLHRLEAWLEEPGVQVVEVYQTPGAEGAPLELQALLRPNELPGQVRRCNTSTSARVPLPRCRRPVLCTAFLWCRVVPGMHCSGLGSGETCQFRPCVISTYPAHDHACQLQGCAQLPESIRADAPRSGLQFCWVAHLALRAW